MDDFLVTPSINFTGTDKIMVCVGVRKLSDATASILLELSENMNSNIGAFYVAAPESTGVFGNYTFKSRGTINTNIVTSGAFLAPVSNVITGVADISGDYQGLRVNSILKNISTEDQGTGTYGNYPLYIGRRAGTSLPFNGQLYGLIIRGTSTDDAKIRTVEKYINGKTRAL